MLRNRFRIAPFVSLCCGLTGLFAVACTPGDPGGSGGDGTGGDGKGSGGSEATGGTTGQGTGGTNGGTGGTTSARTGGTSGNATGGASGATSGGTTGAATGGSAGAPSTGTGGAGGATSGADANMSGDVASGFDAQPLTECPGGSIDRLQKWLAHTLIVGSGGDSSVLVKEGEKYVAKARFQGGDYSELVVQIGNSATDSVDLSQSAGFTITYSATNPVWMEFRGMVKAHGSEQYVVQLPATAGATMTKFVPFDPSAWTFLADLGKPTHSFADVLKTAYIFDIIGKVQNTVAFYGLRFDKYTPPCR
jgi:hypothetical protein